MAHYYPDVLTSIRASEADVSPAESDRKLALEASGWLKSQLLKAAKQVKGTSHVTSRNALVYPVSGILHTGLYFVDIHPVGICVWVNIHVAVETCK